VLTRKDDRTGRKELNPALSKELDCDTRVFISDPVLPQLLLVSIGLSSLISLLQELHRYRVFRICSVLFTSVISMQYKSVGWSTTSYLLMFLYLVMIQAYPPSEIC
jgi:hypothetical protein